MFEYFGTADGLTVYCNVTCGLIVIMGLGVEMIGCFGERFCCVIVTIVSTTFSFLKCDGD